MVYDNPMRVGLGWPHDRAIHLNNIQADNKSERDFHREFMIIAVIFGARGAQFFRFVFSIYLRL